jgi:peptide/nickel transport system permease protein
MIPTTAAPANADVGLTLVGAPDDARRTLLGTVKSIARDRFGRIGFIILSLLAVFTIVTPMLIPSDRLRLNPTEKLQPPGLFLGDGPVFGTDHVGRDLALISAHGVRTSLVVGVGAVLLAAAIGWLLGALAGFFGGWLDSLISRTMDLFNAFPGLVLVIALISALGPSTVNLILILALVSWVTFGRVARVQAMSIRVRPFVDAAAVAGVRKPRLLTGHVRLNTQALMASLCIIELPRMILGEAALSFLGFGMRPPRYSLGSIIADERDYLQVQAWAVTIPGIILAMLCVGTAFVGLGASNVLAVSEAGR